jgi:protein O-mannosyl-transferase
VSKNPLRVHALVAGLLGIVSLVAYAPVLTLSFLADDWAVIRLVTLPDATTNWQTVWEGFYSPLFDRLAKYRPLYSLSFGVDFALFGTEPVGYRLVNLALHAASSFLVYLLALELVPGERRFGTALTAGGLFALHPVHPEAVTWIAGRVDLICAVFFLSTLLLFARWISSDRRLFLWMALASFLLSLMAKEMAVTLPVLLFFLALYGGKSLVGATRSALPFAVLLGAYLLFRAYVLRGLDTYGVAERELEVFASSYGLVYRTLHMLVPLNFMVLPPGWRDLAEPLLLVAAVAAALLLAVACWRGPAGWRLPLLLVCLYAVSLAPVFRSLRPDPNLIHARWLYIPSAFVALLLAYVLWAALARRPRWTLATAACAAFFFVLMLNHGPWLRAGELTERHLETGREPEKPLIHRGVHVFQNKITWVSANSPPFGDQPPDP